jgi:AcrR family transcriptional regulator
MRSRRTRERILRSATRIFADKGFAGARVSELARGARTNPERIYAYFGSKRGLYRAVLIEVYGEVARDEKLLAMSAADIPHLTRKVLDRFFEIHEQNPRFWRLLCWENLNGGRSLGGPDWEHIRHSYLEHLESLYRTGQRQGFFRGDIDFTTYILLLFSTTYFYFSNRMTMSRLLDLDLDRGDVRRRIEREFLRIMDQGLTVVGGG